MLRMTGVSEENRAAAAALEVRDDQRSYLDSAAGILARGEIYRALRARVLVFEDDGGPVGIALVKDFESEPFGYDLQQFMIDRRHQGKGYGSEALEMILGDLRREGRYDRVEVCVKKKNAPAVRFFEKHGFIDSGYIDPEVPDAVSLVCRLF